MSRTLLFLHGAGGFEDDGPLADELGRFLGARVEMPEFSDQDMSFDAWASPIRERLTLVRSDDIVVGHSFGASILVRVLAEGVPFPPGRATLLAMPDWSPRGWDVSDYALGKLAPNVAMQLHHCQDDEVVPFEHLGLNAAALPSASVYEHSSGGHQFLGAVESVAADILRWVVAQPI